MVAMVFLLRFSDELLTESMRERIDGRKVVGFPKRTERGRELHRGCLLFEGSPYLTCSTENGATCQTAVMLNFLGNLVRVYFQTSDEPHIPQHPASACLCIHRYVSLFEAIKPVDTTAPPRLLLHMLHSRCHTDPDPSRMHPTHRDVTNMSSPPRVSEMSH